MTSANDVSPIGTAIARWNVNIIATANGRPARKSTRTGKKTDARTVVYAPMTSVDRGGDSCGARR